MEIPDVIDEEEIIVPLPVPRLKNPLIERHFV